MNTSLILGTTTRIRRKIHWLELVVACMISFAGAISAFGHPNVYLNQREIDEIKGKAATGAQPWKSALDSLIAEANASLGQAPLSVTFQGRSGHSYHTMQPYDWSNNMPSPCGRVHCDGEVNPKADRGDYEAAIKLTSAVRSLGLAYAFTGKAEYAEKAIGLIRVWCLDPATYMEPEVSGPQAIEKFIIFPGLFYGADLIWNYPGWNAQERQSFSQWVKTFGASVATVSYTNNWEDWRQVFVASAGALVEDANLLNHAFNSFRKTLSSHIGSDGRMTKELGRTLSLYYSIFALNAMTQVAEIARHQGVNLYGYKSSGRNLELAWDFHAPFLMNPSTWPWEQIESYNGDGVALYELAYAQKQKAAYLNVIKKYGRPLNESRTMGPVTLTHAFGTAPPSPTEQEGTIAVTVVGSGTVLKDPDQDSYEIGQVVELAALPDGNSEFAGWSGDLSSIDNPSYLRVSESHAVTATFEAPNLTPPTPFVSDDFSGGSLNTSLWTFVNPLGDAQVEVSGGALRIHVPGGVDHDAWTEGNRSPRVMQTVSNTDFEVQVKFQSAVQQRYQLQGLLVEENANKFLRFEVYSDGKAVNLFAASFVNGSPTVLMNTPIATAAGYWLRVKRQGNQWTYSYSTNGTSWTVGAVFSRTLAVSQVGVVGGNAGPSPAFTAVVDYAFNTASPIVPEDGGGQEGTRTPFVPDDFSGGSLNTSLWTFVNPLGDAQVEVSGGALRIHVPGGVDHDAWTEGNRAPRVMQTVGNTDFEVQVKFQSAVQQRYQFQGLLVEEDANKFLRFEVYSDGKAVNLFAASFVNGSPTVLMNTPIATAAGYWLRVKRQGNQWTYSYSTNGTSWTVGAVFSQTLAVSQVGVVGGNAGPSPAFTAVVDYAFNTASPIVPEDGGGQEGTRTPFVPDDFSGGSLNTSLWTFVNPLGDAQVEVSGGALRIHVPGGVDHDVWTEGNRAPRVMQTVGNTDFEVQVKFQSAVQQRFQLQGLLVEEDANKFLRFEVYSDGKAVNLFAASFVNGSPTVLMNTPIATAAGYWLRVKRQGNQWTYSYSTNGTSWTVGAVFSQTLAVSQVGVFGGNAGPSPAFTAVVDYAFNTASPIVP